MNERIIIVTGMSYEALRDKDRVLSEQGMICGEVVMAEREWVRPDSNRGHPPRQGGVIPLDHGPGDEGFSTVFNVYARWTLIVVVFRVKMSVAFPSTRSVLLRRGMRRDVASLDPFT